MPFFFFTIPILNRETDRLNRTILVSLIHTNQFVMEFHYNINAPFGKELKAVFLKKIITDLTTFGSAGNNKRFVKHVLDHGLLKYYVPIQLIKWVINV